MFDFLIWFWLWGVWRVLALPPRLQLRNNMVLCSWTHEVHWIINQSRKFKKLELLWAFVRIRIWLATDLTRTEQGFLGRISMVSLMNELVGFILFFYKSMIWNIMRIRSIILKSSSDDLLIMKRSFLKIGLFLRTGADFDYSDFKIY